jgi:hypothetical protein
VPALWEALQTADPLTRPKAAFLRAHAPALGVVFVCLIFAAYVVGAVCGRRSSGGFRVMPVGSLSHVIA